MALMRAAIVGGLLLVGYVQTAFALGLGEIYPTSHLNESFNAEIELVQVRNLVPNEIIPQLAGREDFDRLGVERFFYLTALQFSVDLSDPNRPVVRITSREPITEPYLNFVVEVLWPSGRLLKEYTVLLDPPAYAGSNQTSLPVSNAPQSRPDRVSIPAPRSQASAAPSGGAAPASSFRQSSAPVTSSAATPSVSRDARFQGDRYGETDRDDTLWEVALQVRPSSDHSVQATMVALVRENPEAFIGGNVNLLKAGYTLRVPSARDVSRISRNEAFAEVARHNDAWQRYRRGGSPRPEVDGMAAPIDARPQTSGQATARTSDPDDGQLRLVSGNSAATGSAGSGDQGGGSGASDGVGASNASDFSGSQRGDADGGPVARLAQTLAGSDQELVAALADAEDESARLARDNDELLGRLQSLESQLEQTDELREREIELRDDRIAELEQQLRAIQEQSGGSPARPASSQDTDSSWTLYGLIAAGVVVLGGVAFWFSRRDRDDDIPVSSDTVEQLAATQQVSQSPLENAVTAAAPPIVGDPAEPVLTDAGDDQDNDEMQSTMMLSPEETAAISEQARDAAAQGGEAQSDTDAAGETVQTSDVIGEADIYIAYGRFPQAISFLQNALEQDPARNDVRLKLMEVFTETRDVEGFNLAGQDLMASDPSEDEQYRAQQLQARLPGADVIAPDAGETEDLPDFDKTVIDASGAIAGMAAEGSGPSIDLDLNLDGSAIDDLAAQDSEDAPPLDIDLNISDDINALAGADEEDGGLDFDLDAALDDALESAPASSEERIDESESSFDLGGDLGLDFDDKQEGDAADGQSSGSDATPIDGNDTLGEFDLSGIGFEEDVPDNRDTVDEAPIDELDDGAELTLDDLEDELSDTIRKPLGAGTVADDSVGDLDLDATLNSTEEPAAPVTLTSASDDLDDESGLDLTIDGSGTAVEPVAASVANDDDLLSIDPDDDSDFELTMDGRSDGLDDTVNHVPSSEDVTALENNSLDETVKADVSADDDFDFLDETSGAGDSGQTKLELAQAYIDMGDDDGAREILNEVLDEGDDSQKQAANDLLGKLST